MNIPLSIIGRSFRLIFAEPVRTLIVIAPGILGSCIASVLFIMSLQLGAGLGGMRIESYPMLGASVIVGTLAWMGFAILWHRHALLDGAERAQVMRPDAGIFWHYFKCSLIIGLIMMVVGFGGGLAFGVVTAILRAAAPIIAGLGAIGLGLLLATGITCVILRISLILPAAATGDTMTCSESWEATRPISRDVFWTAVLLAIINVVIEALASGLAGALPAFDVVFGAVQLALQGLIYVSVLSTLYGHLIQGRSLT